MLKPPLRETRYPASLAGLKSELDRARNGRGAFFGENEEWFRFEDLMFDAERCMQRVRAGFKGALKPG